MKKFFITFVLCIFCMHSFSEENVYLVGQRLGDILTSIVPGSNIFSTSTISIFSEIKATEEGRGYFTLYVSDLSGELTYNVSNGDKFFIDVISPRLYHMLPYNEKQNIDAADKIWVVRSIKNNCIVFEETEQ